MESAGRCRICGGSGKLICVTPNEHGSVKEIRHCRCLDCGLVFVANVLTDAQVSEAYNTLDLDRYYAEIGKTNAAKIRTACLALKRLTAGAPDVRILDIGCGDGQFLLELRRQGYESLAGHEIPGADLSRLHKNGVRVYRDMDWSSVPSDAFDVITMLDVAEHARSPLDLFGQCLRMLRTGGRLYFHTPVVTWLDRVMHSAARVPAIGKLGRIWQRGRTSIFHLQNYSDQSLVIALSRAGFSDIRIRRRNELSWPVRRYVRVYLCEKHDLPPILAPILAPLFYPLLATGLFNANKGIVTARKPEAPQTGGALATPPSSLFVRPPIVPVPSPVRPHLAPMHRVAPAVPGPRPVYALDCHQDDHGGLLHVFASRHAGRNEPNPAQLQSSQRPAPASGRLP